MSVYRIILIILFYFLSASAVVGQTSGGFTANSGQVQSEITNDTHIRGRVENASSSTITFRFVKNTISFEEEILLAPLLVDSSFELGFKLTEPIAMIASYGGKDVKLFIEPGDNLELRFDGKKFPQSIQFSGVGGIHNQYLLAAQEAFFDINVDYLLFEISRRKAMDFRQFMNGLRAKKWNFFQNYGLDNKLSFSPAFVAYAHADIDYWWAYNLIKYRIERPLFVGLPVPLKLEDAYYSFLNEVVISNDKALSNRYYLEFLEEYVNLRQENALPTEVVETEESYFFVDASMVMLMRMPNEMPVIDEPKQGDRLKYLGEHSDFKSKGNYRGKNLEDYWYKVATKDGIEGWVLGVGLERIEQESQKTAATTTCANAESKMERYIVTKVNRLEVRKTPYDEKSVVTVLGWNTELEYLLNKTTESFKCPHNGTNYLDYFYKIKTPTGEIGWIPQFGFEFKEREVKVPTAQNKVVSLGNTAVLQSFLDKKTLYYALAKDLYKRTHQHDLAEVGREIATFRNENPYPTYTKILSAAYEIAQLKGKGDKEFLNTYAYSSLRTPVIAGVRLGMHKSGKRSSKAHTPTVTAMLSDYVEIDARPKIRPTTTTRIKGSFQLPAGEQAKLILYSDPILFKEKRFQLGKNFDFLLQLSEPLVGVIEYGAERTAVYLEPGDQLHVRASGTSLLKNLFFQGKGSTHNQYLLESNRFFEPITSEMEAKIRRANADEFKDFIAKATRKKHTYRERYLKKTAFTNGFKTYIHADIDYWMAFQLMNYTIEHPLYHGGNERMELPTSYYDFFDEIALSPQGVLPNANYTYFLNEYLEFQSEKAEHKGLTHQELAEQFLDKEARYFIKAKEMSIACKRGKGLAIGPSIERFIEDCPYEVYNDVLRFVYNESKGLIVGVTAPNFSLKDIDGKATSLDDLKGKVVFLDFWATWCNPCVRSLHHSRKLNQAFAGKDVAFVYISLDETPENWSTYLKEHDLAGIHLHAGENNTFNSEIARLYKVKKLPTYILIDKNGKIAFNPAKNPGNSQLTAQINDLLSRRRTND